MTARDNADPQTELVLVRILDAPRDLVFELWTDPRHLAQWWGPKGFTNPVCELDARPGGAIRIEMRGPDGAIYPMGGTVREIDAPRRFIFTSTAFENSENEPELVNVNTVTFEDLDGRTKLTLHVRVEKAGPGTEQALAGMDQGWSESFERLLDFTGVEAATLGRHLVGTRLIAAPREVVWKAWTNPEQIAEWWGPKGFTNTIQKMDVQPGGTWRLIMRGPDGAEFPNEFRFVEVVPPQYLAFDHVSPPHFRFCVTFIAEGDETCVTVRMLFPSAVVRNEAVKKFGAAEGLHQNLERLAAFLASAGDHSSTQSTLENQHDNQPVPSV